MRSFAARADGLFSRAVPLLFAMLALGVLFAAPFWAYRWYRLPFTGLFLEPNLIVSAISGADWPAARLGVRWPDQLIEVNNQPVSASAQVEARLVENGFDPLRLRLRRPSGAEYQVVFTPRSLRPFELFTQFGVPYLVAVIFVLCGWWTYLLAGRQRPARAFLLVTAAAGINAAAFLDMNTTHHFVLGWSLSLPLLAGSLVHLALVYPRPMPLIERRPLLRYSPWIAALLVAAPIARDILFPATPFAHFTSWRLGYISIALGMIILLTVLVVRLFTADDPVVRQQSRIILYGAALAFGPILFLYLGPSIFGGMPRFISALFMPPLVILPLSIAYSIVRFRMLDLDQLLSRAVGYGLITLAAVSLFYILIGVASLVVQSQLNPNNPLVLATYLFLLVLLFNPLRDLAMQAIDRVFYRTRADYRGVLTTLSRELVVTTDLSQTWQRLEREITAALNPLRLMLFLYDDERRLFIPYGQAAQSDLTLEPDSPLALDLAEANPALWLPEIGRLAPTEFSRGALANLPAKLNCQVFAPLRYEKRMIGFLALGARRAGAPYSRDDLEFLGAVAAQSSLAVENARLFANQQRTLDETLEIKTLMDDIFASITSGVITTNLAGQITLFNEAAEEIFTLPAAQALGRPLFEALALFAPKLEAMLEYVLQRGEVVIEDEALATHAQRGELHLRLETAPLRDARGVISGVTIVIDDLTGQRRLEAERDRIRKTFGQVVAPRVRDRLLADPSNLHLEGVQQVVTVMFADMSGFTSFSEQNPPDELFRVLNSYLSLAAQSVLEQEGTLDKFVGDAIMAFWNAPDQQPDHALRAVRAALDMEAAFRRHHAELPSEHHFLFSIGIATGEAMIGNIGTAELFNYTAIGDTINLAQRLETVAQPGQILLAESTYQMIAGLVVAEPLQPLHLKGKERPVQSYLLKDILPA